MVIYANGREETANDSRLERTTINETMEKKCSTEKILQLKIYIHNNDRYNAADGPKTHAWHVRGHKICLDFLLVSIDMYCHGQYWHGVDCQHCCIGHCCVWQFLLTRCFSLIAIFGSQVNMPSAAPPRPLLCMSMLSCGMCCIHILSQKCAAQWQRQCCRCSMSIVIKNSSNDKKIWTRKKCCSREFSYTAMD